MGDGTPSLTSISLRAVTRLFGHQRALHQFSLELAAGEVVAVVGPNGAGKSTLLSILAMTARPTSGELLVNGEPANPAGMRARIGYLSHKPFVVPELTCASNLKLYCDFYGVAPARVDSLKEELDLGAFFDDRPTGVLSRGQLQRVALARALIAGPELLLLDEPSTGLDKGATERIAAVVDRHKEKGGVTVVVSHEPRFVARVATRVVALRQGAKVADKAGPLTPEQVEALLAAAPEQEAV